MASHYIETSIPSFYFEVRTEPSMIARRDWTRKWWAQTVSKDELLTSPAVIDELAQGDFPSRESALDLLKEIPLLEINSSISEIIQAYCAPSHAC